MADFKIGTVTHYYEQIGIAIVDLIAILHVGDRVRFSGSNEFSQLVELIQVESEEVQVAQAGETVGLKTRQPLLPGDEVVKLNG